MLESRCAESGMVPQPRGDLHAVRPRFALPHVTWAFSLPKQLAFVSKHQYTLTNETDYILDFGSGLLQASYVNETVNLIQVVRFRL